MRDSTIIGALKALEDSTYAQLEARDAMLDAHTQQVNGLTKALLRFTEMSFVERVGWVVLGPRWLVARWKRQIADANTPGD